MMMMMIRTALRSTVWFGGTLLETRWRKRAGRDHDDHHDHDHDDHDDHDHDHDDDADDDDGVKISSEPS